MSREFLSSIKVEDVAVKGREVVIVDAADSIPQILNTLVKNNILCAPVYDKNSDKFIGLVDMLDLVTFIVETVDCVESLSSDYSKFLEKDDLFKRNSAKDIADLSKRNRMVPVPLGASLLEAMETMTRNSVQRIPIMEVNQKGDFVKIHSILTESNVLSFLAKSAPKLDSWFNKPLKELGFHTKKVISIDVNRPAIEAFRLMVKFRVSGIPILDSEGKVLANISARDLRAIANDQKMFHYLFLDVGDLVTHIRLSEPTAKTVHPSISCSFDDSLSKVIAKLSAAHIHRIYVTENRLPCSVVSLHDIVTKIVNFDN
eukprot:TRINITY_DN2147_c0_g1_i4.p1 TRINITY_DN2147_c0_g1~~TRINITY_DN2147_c0_g1_i4.p1  ORF type:complete len:315 (+),score=46.60 TRINITY_DN2147_c0_g1_i4:441-1385(+)